MAAYRDSLAELGADLASHLDATFPGQDAIVRQTLAMAEETGELIGAVRRWHGMARRRGTFAEVVDELADVVITAYITAHVLGIDVDAAVASKAERIYTRGWREPAPT